MDVSHPRATRPRLPGSYRTAELTLNEKVVYHFSLPAGVLKGKPLNSKTRNWKLEMLGRLFKLSYDLHIQSVF